MTLGFVVLALAVAGYLLITYNGLVRLRQLARKIGRAHV